MIDNTNQVKVTIRCLVYNHASYLRQCLDGFVMQKTNFKFEAIVHDDASTDESASIIKEYAAKYPDIIIPILETENLYSKGIDVMMDKIDSKIKGKYIAFCEGDDYWIDPNKLQLQHDIMEENPNIALCYTKSRTFFQKKQLFSKIINAEKGPTDFEGMLLREPPLNLTSFYRHDMYQKFKEEIDPYRRGWLMGDTPLWLWLSLHGDICLLDRVTSIYRVLESSASHSNNIEDTLRYNKSTMEIRKYFCERYHKEELIPWVEDAYKRSCMSDAARINDNGLFFDNFKEITRKKAKDYVIVLKYLVQRVL